MSDPKLERYFRIVHLSFSTAVCIALMLPTIVLLDVGNVMAAVCWIVAFLLGSFFGIGVATGEFIERALFGERRQH